MSFSIDIIVRSTPATWLARHVLEEIGVRPYKTGRFVVGGEVIQRDIGAAIVRILDFETIDDVVFAEAGDRRCIGHHTLDGLQVNVDHERRTLTPRGPSPTLIVA